MDPHSENVLQLKKIHYDMVMLRRRLVEVKSSAGLLCSEALHHQLMLMLDNLDQRLLGPSKDLNLNLKDKYLDLMKRKSEVQQKISVIGLSEVKVGMKRVLGFMEEPAPLPSPKHRKQQQDEEMEDSGPEKGVFKLYETEGTIGETAYAAKFIVKNAPDQKAGKVAELEDLRLGTQSLVTKKMLTPGRVTMPETVGCFTANLYYYKVLYDERQETLNQLESDVPGVEITGHTEPVVLQLLSHGQHQVEVVWELVWDNPNCRFKYNIVVNCTEEVVTRYSTADIYPYLSGQQKLETPQGVLSFAETFTEL